MGERRRCPAVLQETVVSRDRPRRVQDVSIKRNGGGWKGREAEAIDWWRFSEMSFLASPSPPRRRRRGLTWGFSSWGASPCRLGPSSREAKWWSGCHHPRPSKKKNVCEVEKSSRARTGPRNEKTYSRYNVVVLIKPEQKKRILSNPSYWCLRVSSPEIGSLTTLDDICAPRPVKPVQQEDSWLFQHWRLHKGWREWLVRYKTFVLFFVFGGSRGRFNIPTTPKATKPMTRGMFKSFRYWWGHNLCKM